MSDQQGKDVGDKTNANANAKPQAPGDGIRSLKTSQAFRALNFELYAKPNKTVMAVGLALITLSGGYLTYMNMTLDKENFYEATNEDGSTTLRPKKSRWDS